MLQYGTALIFELHKKKGNGRRRRSERSSGRWEKKRSRRRTLRQAEEWTEEESIEDKEIGEKAREKYSPDDLLVKIFLMEGIEKQAAVVRELKISGCSTDSGGGGDEGGGGGGGGGSGGCSLSRITEMFQEIAVWSQAELMEICNGTRCTRERLFFHILGALFLYFLLLPAMS